MENRQGLPITHAAWSAVLKTARSGGKSRGWTGAISGTGSGAGAGSGVGVTTCTGAASTGSFGPRIVMVLTSSSFSGRMSLTLRLGQKIALVWVASSAG